MVSIVAKLFILFSMAGNERKHLIFPFGFFDFPHPRIHIYLYVLIKVAKLGEDNSRKALGLSLLELIPI